MCEKNVKYSKIWFVLQFSNEVINPCPELIYSAKAEKTFVAQSQVPPAILEKHDKFIGVWVLASY